MNTFLKLSLLALAPITVSVLLYLLEKRTGLTKLNTKTKQIIYGLVFGLLAVMGTEFGVNVNGAILNTRDAAALIAGLVFGSPAGIIAGLIGGIERIFAVYWGAGQYTMLACSVSTIVAGLFGAVLRRYMFDDKKPSPAYALGIGLVTEVFHMLMIFFTNMNDIRRAFSFVESASLPMITVNGIAVMLSVLVITLLGKEKVIAQQSSKSISIQFQRWLLLTVVLAFLLTSGFTTVLQVNTSETNQNDLLKLNIQDVISDISDISDRSILQKTHNAASRLSSGASLDDITKYENLSEINIVNAYGIITHSTNPEYVGFDMNSGEQSRAFMILTQGTTEYVQSFQPIAKNSSVYMKYAGVALPDNSFIQAGYTAEQFSMELSEIVVGLAQNRHVGETGYLVIASDDGVIISDKQGNNGKTLADIGIALGGKAAGTKFITDVNGEKCYCMYDISDSYFGVIEKKYLIISVYPQTEALFQRNLSVYVTVFMEIVVFIGLFILIYFLIKKLVVNNIKKVNSSLAQITNGNLNVVIDVKSNEEFASLSDDINSTVDTLKRYISEAAARIDKELEFAKSIQLSTLPSMFPPYPDRKDFDIYALMNTAREVGGDFYDFFFVGQDRLAFLIADVSGKGIPAAMFMMTAKTLIKGFAEAGESVDAVFTHTNEKLCENNEANMFVTAWMGIIDLKTGTVEFANAGHNPPLVMHRDGSFEYLKTRPGLVLAGMDGIKYKRFELTLKRGERIFMYTDGVTEAADGENALFGESRLKTSLDAHANASVEELCNCVMADVNAFAGDAEQFDDITMLTLFYKGDSLSNELEIPAKTENVTEVTQFVNNCLEELDCPEKARKQLDVAIDEVFSNISNYAYGDSVGTALITVSFDEAEGIVRISFCDSGAAYNPLLHDDPDITLSAQDREPGGLGIYLTKKLTDEIKYERVDDKNILTVGKRIR